MEKLAELQSKWLTSYEKTMERMLTSMAEKIHKEYLIEREKVTNQLDGEIELELASMKAEIRRKYEALYGEQTSKFAEKHRAEIVDVKKKQWCRLCSAEAIYFCCWNTNYCSAECQQKNWSDHKSNCCRKGEKLNT